MTSAHDVTKGVQIPTSEESGKEYTSETSQETAKELGMGEIGQRDWVDVLHKVHGLEERADKIEGKIDNFDEKIKDSNLKTIETLGIFVALFTFVSVSFNIFNRISDLWSAGIFTLLVFSALSLMVLLLDILVKGENIGWKILISRILLACLFVGFTVLSLYFLRDFPVNPTPAPLEFEAGISQWLQDKLEVSLNKNNGNFYNKAEVDNLLKQLNK